MLPQFYRIIGVNNTGQTLTYNSNGRLNLKMTAWKWDTTNGDVVYTQLSDDDMDFDAGRSIVDGAEVTDEPSLVATAEINNTSNEYVGLQIQLELTHDAGTAADGTYDLYLDGGDATGELASDASGYGSAEANKLHFVGSLTWEPNGGDDEVMRSSVFNL